MAHPERFDEYMERVLYGPGGFYATSGTAGRRRGDFITNPEVGPLFGAVVAEALDSWWDELGRPDPWPVYDVGCGPGTLLKAIEAAKPDRPWDLIGVDRVVSSGARLRQLPDDLAGMAVVANELLDNLPFRIVERRADGFVEVFVADGDDPHELLEPTDVELDIPVGTRAPYHEEAAAWVASVVERAPARLCLFDYGAPTTAELATRSGWLRTFRDHRRGSDPLVAPGTVDITTDIAWDQFPGLDPPIRQADFLRAWGIERLVEAGRRYWRDHASAPDLMAMKMRSRIPEADALLDPNGLGGWWVATWTSDATKSY